MTENGPTPDGPAESGTARPTGIFVARGMTLSIPEGGLRIRDDGQVSIDLHVRFDVVPTWLSISIGHKDRALQISLELADAWKGTDENKKALLVEAEFEAAIQAIVAAATTFEALFAVLKPLVISQETVEKWKKKRPKRYMQIAEVCRIAFQLPPKGCANFQKNLKEIYLLETEPSIRQERLHRPWPTPS